MRVNVAIGLGGNIGNVQHRFSAVREQMSAFLGQVTMAPVFITAPVDCVPGTPDFCNSALTGTFDGTPLELLERCQAMERSFGRPICHSSRESRTLDLDILLFGEELVSLPQLIIPHPRLLVRRFALEPLASIASEWRIPPAMTTVKECLAALVSHEKSSRG